MPSPLSASASARCPSPQSEYWSSSKKPTREFDLEVESCGFLPRGPGLNPWTPRAGEQTTGLMNGVFGGDVVFHLSAVGAQRTKSPLVVRRGPGRVALGRKPQLSTSKTTSCSSVKNRCPALLKYLPCGSGRARGRPGGA